MEGGHCLEGLEAAHCPGSGEEAAEEMGIVVPAVDGQRLLVRLEEVYKGLCLQGAGPRLEAVVEGGQRLEALQPQRMVTSGEDCCCCRWCWVLVLGAC